MLMMIMILALTSNEPPPPAPDLLAPFRFVGLPSAGVCGPRLRTNEVNTNGAAAKVVNCSRLGKKARADNFGKIKQEAG